MELNRRHYLLIDVLDVAGELLWVTGRDGGILKLGIGGIVLNVVHLSLLVITTEQAIWDLVEQAFNYARVIFGVVLQSTLELIKLTLRQLVGD